PRDRRIRPANPIPGAHGPMATGVAGEEVSPRSTDSGPEKTANAGERFRPRTVQPHRLPGGSFRPGCGSKSRFETRRGTSVDRAGECGRTLRENRPADGTIARRPRD